jgi:hypothetical protein
MDKKKATTSDNSSSGQASTTSEDATERRRGDISIAQNVLLVWLDNNIDEDDNDCRNTLAQLRRVINVVNTSSNRDQCVDFLTNIDTVKVFMIISAELSEDIVPLIHNVAQLDSILIFCDNSEQHEQ